ncbi:mannitol dehydrogenase family protein [Neotabrizicola shimadae]|uniref:Mannitol dehydrogenase family protein n=1 Tax=Neotabrizicola shimadae TaxID=2807096 RepID=A0A8G1EDF6_9RHOB|nr:mannitol dehydrogenase family protein [Neotabrizicola shimadae]QYZ69359.1 mannitol dehydrogenase family protein [Neotabrizicola shimadae]
MPKTPILQFGTSRFLQAHADLFLSEGRASQGPVTVVQSSGDAGRSSRLAALAGPQGFAVRIQGLERGQPVTREQRVTSVVRALNSATDWTEICRIGAEEARIILSNTSEKGFVPQPADAAPAFDQAMSYPAKLTHLLLARFRAGGAPVQVMPTELVARNGEVLRDRVMELSRPLDMAFADWVAGQVIFANSLVDRIVSAPLEPAGALAEPYALWAIEARPGLIAPVLHPAVQIVDDLGPIERRKLYILNLGHTWMVARWAGRSDISLVREVMADPAWRSELAALYRDEVLPVFAAAEDGTAAAYVDQTMDRFANPYLDHRLSDIAQNHAEKLQRRVAAFLAWAETLGLAGRQPRLAALLA